MAKKEKAYCGNCIHFSRQKKDKKCAKAATITVPNTATYMYPDTVRKQYCWEKNEKNRCRDYEKKLSISEVPDLQ